MNSYCYFAIGFYGICILPVVLQRDLIEYAFSLRLQLDFIEYALSLWLCIGISWNMHSHCGLAGGFYRIYILTFVLQWDFLNMHSH